MSEIIQVKQDIQDIQNKQDIQTIQTEKSKLYVIDNFIQDHEYYFELCNNLELNSNPKIFIFNKECIMHRDIGFYSDNSIGYKYSWQIARSKKLLNWMNNLLIMVNDKLKTDFNGILINKYKNGNDYIGAHSDDEKSLSNNSSVACITLGEERIFRIKNKTNNQKIDIITKSGQLLVMEGNFQKEFTHEIPIQKRKKNIRISLSFRKHLE